ncbi:MAG: hypothetical protein A2152_03155 [Candidatus Levybacteria bacterium RBG_16_35_6]|nr:MAG: hypothetical protein A2152_03155 [Candidatus Levybacteria bacterium RBG_16_35_6]HJX45689.1 hypothetical protein [Patescibacteria group bacterium]
MINKSSIRYKNKEKFKECIRLRKQGLSYSEIRKIIPVAKSTLQNWLTFAGLTLTKEHLEIQVRKRLEKQQIAVEASKITRQMKKEKEINKTLELHKKYFNDPFYNYGLALFEAEGCKESRCRFSNSDFRLIDIFIKYIEKYFLLKKENNMVFRLHIHETRKNDLKKIIGFWSKKINISPEKIKISWKKNKIMKRRENPEYVGQMSVSVSGESILGSKILAISDIILKRYKKIFI